MTPGQILQQHGPREAMACDVVIVGAGPAGLATAIQLKQLAAEHGRELSVVVLEKGSEPGAHILSGAIIDPRALTELLPHWKEQGAPLTQPVTEDEFLFLTRRGAHHSPVLPDCFHNDGCYVASLGNVTRWLSAMAEALGVEIFAGFAAAEVLYDDDGAVKGVATGNVGIGKDGAPTAGFQLGMELHGHDLRRGRARPPRQTADRALRPRRRTRPAELRHRHQGAVGDRPGEAPAKPGRAHRRLAARRPDLRRRVPLPLGRRQGDARLHHRLDYSNPYLSPFDELQRWKTHPAIRTHLEGGKRIGYGARAITGGGLLSLPKTVFPGGALVGCDAGYLNASRIKGSHAAIKTGMLAAEAAFAAIAEGRQHDELTAYPEAFRASWLHAELHTARNFKQWFKRGLLVGTLMNGIEQWLLPKLGLKAAPWTVHREAADHACLKPAADCRPIDYPKPDGKLTFDRLSSVFLSNTNHEENQPAHLTLKDAAVPVATNLARYAGPETRYCPAGVYEFVKTDAGADKLQINAQNCVHCKTCDIKDPTQNIVWVTPEGSGGPNYAGM